MAAVSPDVGPRRGAGSMTRLAAAILAALLPSLAALCPGEVSSAAVSFRFRCEPPSSLRCVGVLAGSQRSFYAARASCERINGTLLELRNSAALACFERAKLSSAPGAPFWLNIVEVNTPRCEGNCPGVIDMRWASDLPPDVCLRRSPFARSCSRAGPAFSCAQRGCCDVSTDHRKPSCLLPTSPAAGKLHFHKFAATKVSAKVPGGTHGRRCAFVDASRCRDGSLGNSWRLQPCDGGPRPQGCARAEKMRVACSFPMRPTAPAEFLPRPKKEQKPCPRGEKADPGNAIFWFSVGAILSASVIILFQLMVWCRLRREQVSSAPTAGNFAQSAAEATNPNFEENWSDEESWRPEDDSRRRLHIQDS